MTTQTVDQKRAQHALSKISNIKSKSCGHYVSYVSALPATVVMNGLGQALVTLLAKAGRKQKPKEDPNYFLYEQVASWLSEQIQELNGDVDAVVEQLMQNDQQIYLRAQAESLAYIRWLKQFARAYLTEPEGEQND